MPTQAQARPTAALKTATDNNLATTEAKNHSTSTTTGATATVAAGTDCPATEKQHPATSFKTTLASLSASPTTAAQESTLKTNAVGQNITTVTLGIDNDWINTEGKKRWFAARLKRFELFLELKWKKVGPRMEHVLAIDNARPITQTGSILEASLSRTSIHHFVDLLFSDICFAALKKRIITSVLFHSLTDSDKIILFNSTNPLPKEKLKMLEKHYKYVPEVQYLINSLPSLDVTLSNSEALKKTGFVWSDNFKKHWEINRRGKFNEFLEKLWENKIDAFNGLTNQSTKYGIIFNSISDEISQDLASFSEINILLNAGLQDVVTLIYPGIAIGDDILDIVRSDNDDMDGNSSVPTASVTAPDSPATKAGAKAASDAKKAVADAKSDSATLSATTSSAPAPGK